MIEVLKEALGLANSNTEYDLYLVIIGSIGLIWITKQVISAIYNAVLHIFI